MRMIQNQGTTSKAAVKVPKWRVLTEQGKKIKETLSMLIRVLEESGHVWDVFQIILYGLHTKLFTFLSLFLFRFVFFFSFRLKIALDILFLFPI